MYKISDTMNIHINLNSMIVFLFTLSLMLVGCKERKEVQLDSEKKENNKEGKTSKKKVTSLKEIQSTFPPEQLALINRKDFDKTVLSYDTTDLIDTDSLPYRLLSYKERHNRKPWKKKIAGYEMKGTPWGYEYQDKNWTIKTDYPGVLSYHPANWGGYVKKIEHYDNDGQLLHSMDIDDLSPYFKKLTNIKPGAYDFESMSISEQKVTDDYKRKATQFLEDRSITPQKTTDWTVITYKLLALYDKDDILGFESTIEVYDEQGELQYSKVLPFSTQYEFISSDNKYLVFAPARAEEYMIKRNEIEGELFIVDLESQEIVYTEKFDDNKIKFSTLREDYNDGLVRVSFLESKRWKKDEKPINFFFNLKKRTLLYQEYDKLKEAYSLYKFNHPLEGAKFNVNSY